MQRERGTQLVRDPDAQLKKGERGGTLGEVSVGGERARCEVPQWLASLSERFGLYSVHRGDPLKRE